VILKMKNLENNIVICVFSKGRWPLLDKCLESIQWQDFNPALFLFCTEDYKGEHPLTQVFKVDMNISIFLS